MLTSSLYPSLPLNYFYTCLFLQLISPTAIKEIKNTCNKFNWMAEGTKTSVKIFLYSKR